MRNMRNLPKKIYVSVKEKGSNDAWLCAEKNLDEDIFENGETVGEYQLIRTSKLKVSRDLE